MSSDDHHEALIARLADMLRPVPAILAAYLHGSFGRSTFRADSDLDCAILLQPGQALAAKERLQLAGDLSAAAGITVDLGVMSFENLIYFVEAVHHGQRFLCKDATLADALVGRAFSLYVRLKEERKEVEAAYHVA